MISQRFARGPSFTPRGRVDRGLIFPTVAHLPQALGASQAFLSSGTCQGWGDASAPCPCRAVGRQQQQQELGCPGASGSAPGAAGTLGWARSRGKKSQQILTTEHLHVLNKLLFFPFKVYHEAKLEEIYKVKKKKKLQQPTVLTESSAPAKFQISAPKRRGIRTIQRKITRSPPSCFFLSAFSSWTTTPFPPMLILGNSWTVLAEIFQKRT